MSLSKRLLDDFSDDESENNVEIQECTACRYTFLVDRNNPREVCGVCAKVLELEATEWLTYHNNIYE